MRKHVFALRVCSNGAAFTTRRPRRSIRRSRPGRSRPSPTSRIWLPAASSWRAAGAHESFGHYRAALAIFPDAQSALVGASQAAVMATDVPAAMTLVQKLGESTARFDADPWWNYHLGAGRDVDDLMAALWARVPK